jgi:hypothetical protein
VFAAAAGDEKLLRRALILLALSINGDTDRRWHGIAHVSNRLLVGGKRHAPTAFVFILRG